MDSNHTPCAKLLDSSEGFINLKKQNNIVKSLQESLKEVNSILPSQEREEIEK
jgi:hypothetical protein